MAEILVYPNLNPRIIMVLAPTTEITMQELVDLVRAYEDSNMGMYYPYFLSSSGKEDLGGGVSVGITVNLINSKLRFQARPDPLETGICTMDNLRGNILTATGGDFINSVIYAGCTVFNYTTAAMETVIDVTDSTSLISFGLQAGTRQTWLDGDLYSIYPNPLCNVSGGNLVAVDSNGAAMDPIMPSPNNYIVRASSSSSTFQDIEAIQYSSYQNAVWVDSNSSLYGTAYPSGTREFPVNNIVDAVYIANERGFDALQILSSMSIGSNINITGFKLIGKSHTNTIIVISANAQCENITIENCNVSGVLDGGTHITKCIAGNLTYVNGHIHESGLIGVITLNGNEDAVFANCYTIDQDDPITINMGGSGQSLAMPNYSGVVTVTNFSDSTSEIGIGLHAGQVNLEPSITAGSIIISGTGMLNDNTTGTTIVNSVGLINTQNIADSVLREILSDHISEEGSLAYVINRIKKETGLIPGLM